MSNDNSMVTGTPEWRGRISVIGKSADALNENSVLIGRYLKKKVRLGVGEKLADVVDEKDVLIGRPE